MALATESNSGDSQSGVLYLSGQQLTTLWFQIRNLHLKCTDLLLNFLNVQLTNLVNHCEVAETVFPPRLMVKRSEKNTRHYCPIAAPVLCQY